MFNVEEETRRIEQLYRRLTGSEPRKNGTSEPIPDDANAETYVRERLARLEAILMSSGAGDAATQLPVLTPRISLSQRSGEWICAVELPGVPKSDVSLRLTGGELRVSAYRRAPEAGARSTLVYSELTPCRFERVIAVPPAVRTDTVEARLENGLLTVRFAVQSASTAQEIEIGTA